MESIFEAIDKEQDQMVALLKKWASVNSYSSNLYGLAQMLKLIKEEAAKLNGKMEEICLAPRKIIDSKGNPLKIAHGKALIIKKNEQAKTKVLLAGHYDTVFPVECPFQKTRLIKKNILQGPGVADMKGGLIILLTSLKILESSSYAGKLGFEVIINPDEEVGSIGSSYLFKQAASGKVAGLIFEPSFPDGSFVNSRKGSANFTLIVKGVSAHAGRDFDKGRSAITALSRFIYLAESLNCPKDGIIINFGMIHGGGPINIVPDFANCHINLRVNRCEDLKKIKRYFNQLIKSITLKLGVSFKLHELSSRDPKPLDEKTAELFDILKKVSLKQGIEMKSSPSGGVTDGNTLATVGLPTIDTLGVIGGNLHTFKEYALLDSLKERVKLTVGLLIELINRGPL